MTYTVYHFKVSPPQPGSEVLMAVLAELGFESFVLAEDGLTGYIVEELARGLDLGAIRFDDFVFTFTAETIPAENWNAEWEKNFQPVVVGDLLCIRAPFHEKNHQVRHEIVIMPKMSFGTGHHQTTRLVCAAMCTIDLAGARVLDMGCGTGILAILAGQLGASEITGVDIDDWSVTNAIENGAANNFPAIHILKGDIDIMAGKGPFGVILANINKNILKRHMPAYAALLDKNGRLLISGFLTTDVTELEAVCKSHGLSVEKTQTEEEWAMMVLKKI